MARTSDALVILDREIGDDQPMRDRIAAEVKKLERQQQRSVRRGIVPQVVKVIPCYTDRGSKSGAARNHGYTLRWDGDNKPDWVTAWGNTFEWYRFRTQAQERADEINAQQAQKEAVQSSTAIPLSKEL